MPVRHQPFPAYPQSDYLPMGAFLRADVAKWTRVVQESGIKPD